MVFFKVNDLMMLVLIVLSIECIIAPTKKEVDIARIFCKLRIRDYFKGSDVRKLAKHAILSFKLTGEKPYKVIDLEGLGLLRVEEMNSIAKDYYLLFGEYVHTGSVKPPNEFCKTRTDPGQCRKNILNYFTRDPLENVKWAFYKYKKGAIFKILDDTNDYWNSILNGFGLHIGPNHMPTPDEYCDRKSPYDENEEADDDVDHNPEHFVGQSSDQK